MNRLSMSTWLLVLFLSVFCVRLPAQAPVGTITGTITDTTGAVVPSANITITNKTTGTGRTTTANADGLYSASALPAGDYEVRAEMQGFRTVVRDAQVTAGSTTTVDLALSVGETREVVNVEAASAQINYESHAVQGTIERQSIQELPLNGRSFLQLSTLEPGVTAVPGPLAQFNSQFYVNILGSGAGSGIGPLITVDGGVINDEMEGGSSMNFSQEVVEEFQLSSLNYDIATGGTSAGGALNIVTRSGSNAFHGSGYFFYRDHNMSAYPGLERLAIAPNPFFARKNPGFWVGGPIVKDKVFFFFNLEKMWQTTVYPEQQDLPSLQPLNGIFASPYRQTLITARFDYHISTKHTLFVRYSHDGNFSFGPYFFGTVAPLPAQWNTNDNWSDQNIMGLTSALTPNLVNDFRFQFHYWQNNVQDATPQLCPNCVGFGLPTIYAMIGSATFGSGQNDNSPQFRQARSFEPRDDVSWQKGPHRIRFGIDYEHMWTKTVPWDYCDPGCVGLWSPEAIQGILGSATSTFFPNLPTSIRTTADVLNLPIFNAPNSIYSGFGVGNGTFPGGYEHNQGGINQRIHLYVGDTWKIKPNLTVNYGLGYELETGLFYSNLNLPQFLAPIFEGETGGVPYGLGATQPNKTDFAPQFGFAWSPGTSKKWVIRGGGGMFWDTQPIWEHFREGSSIGPVGDGRTTLASSAFTNTIPNIQVLGVGPLPIGAPIPTNALTTMTLGQFLQVYNQQFPTLEQELAPPPPASGPFTVAGIDVAKQGVEIYPSHFPLLRTYQTSVGVQRDLGHDMVITVDWARRQGENINLGELDLNRSARVINGVPSPVIPFCTAAQYYNPSQECSTGAITVWTPEGREVFNALLVKFQKRMSHRVQATISYSLQKDLTEDTTAIGIVNYDNYFAGYGPTLARHQLNIAGVGDLPWGFRLSLNSAIISRTPVEPTIAGVDLFGSGVIPTALSESAPNNPFNCFAWSCGKAQLASAVAYFNANWAGKTDADGTPIPQLVLPQSYDFGKPLITQDMRLTKDFAYRERYHLSVFGEFFNLFNIANLTGYNFNLDAYNATACGPLPAGAVTTTCAAQTYAFGQPTSRVSNVFGSGGPRAIQVGARFSF